MSQPAARPANVTYLAGAAPGDALLATKLAIPPTRPALVARPRLTALLDDTLHARLALVSAPPGSGKSTLLSSWLGSAGHPAAWVSLDPADNDPLRFWSYVAAALEGAVPGCTGATRALLRSLDAPAPDALLTALVNALAALPDDLILVLDDYHVLTAPPIHQTLAALLDHLPPRLHVVLASREDPPLPLARLRARGQLVEIRAADLRFTADEAAAFLRDVMGLRLTPEQVAALEERTEGWAAGLQLAALSMRGRDDVAGFLGAFAGSHRYIVDYLTGELLDRQPADVQRFLLRTSILDRFTAPLCDAVTAAPGTGAPMLRRLARANLFLIALDDEDRWFRYHHLFADALRARLREAGSPDAADGVGEPELHRRAAAWLEAADLLEEAVAHAVAAGDACHAADLAVRRAAALWTRGEAAQMRTWLEGLPPTIVRARPRLGMYLAWATFVTGHFTIDERLLADVERDLLAETPEEERRVVTGALLMMRAFAVRARGDHAECERLAGEALATLPPGELTIRGLASICLGHAAYARGDLSAAHAAYRAAGDAGEVADDTFTRMASTIGLATIEEERANLPAAHAIYSREFERYPPEIARFLPAIGYLETGLGSLLAAWDRLDEAEAHARRARELGRLTQISDFRLNAPLLLAYIHQARGELTQAGEALDEAERVVHTGHTGGDTWLAAAPRAARAKLALAGGDLPAAARWAAAAERNPLLRDDRYALDGPARLVRLTLARVRLAEGRPDDALALLAPLACAAQTGQRAALLECALLQALALHAKDEPDAALDAIESALALAEPSGYRRLFLDERAPMAALLADLRARRGDRLAPALRAYLDALLAAFAAAPQPSAQATPSATPPAGPDRMPAEPSEPLSEREREALALVAAGASNAEIAARMVVSIHTVKTHLTHTFAKLGVASRTQAIARARDLGLV